jgi:hypothetical protein
VTTAHDLIAELPEGAEVVPLLLIRRLINEHLGPWTPAQQASAIGSGSIRPIKKTRGPVGGSHPRKYVEGPGVMVDRDQAVLILVAAVLAFAAKTEVPPAIRLVRASGVDLSVFVQAQVQKQT